MLYDAIVVGSGPGGAAAAARLSRERKSVLLVDRQAFPRDKVCGDFVPSRSIRLLKELGLDVQAEGPPIQSITGRSVVVWSGELLRLPRFANNNELPLTLSRWDFDLRLHQHALSCGAQFAVMDVRGPLLRTKDGKRRVAGIIERRGNQLVEHEARAVIAADGASSAIARALLGRVSEPSETAIAIRAYVRLNKPMFPDTCVKYAPYLDPGYGWIFPLGQDRANVGLGLLAANKHGNPTLKELLNRFLTEISPLFDFELLPDTVKTWPLPFCVDGKSRVVDGAYLVGDAGRFVSARTTIGITSAIYTGMYAADAVIRELGGTPAEEAARFYDESWRRAMGGKWTKDIDAVPPA